MSVFKSIKKLANIQIYINLFKYITRLRKKGKLKKTLDSIALRRSDTAIKVCYSGILDRFKNEAMHGGAVKIKYLNDVFPEDFLMCNILYLVSSCLPEYPGEWVSWAKRNGLKVVLNQNGVAYQGWAGKAYKRVNKILREAITGADYILYQSEYCKEMADLMLGEVSTEYKILYNSVDTKVFTPSISKYSKNDRWEILSMGSHVKEYRVFSALETIMFLKEARYNIHFTLCGRIPWDNGLSRIRSKIMELGIVDVVTILPEYSQGEAPDIYRNSHVLLHPKYKDPCPTVVIEALACGLPIVGSNSGGMPELVGEHAGILVDVPDTLEQLVPPSPRKMAEAIIQIMENHEEYSRAARKRAEREFATVNWIDFHKELFLSILSMK